jgi:hypothetical protein
MPKIARPAVVLLSCATVLALAGPAAAKTLTAPVFGTDASPVPALASFTLAPAAAAALVLPDTALPDSGPAADAAGGQRPTPPKAVEYSDGYKLRAKIHKYASFATLPLFVTEAILGQSLYNDTPTTRSSNRGVHGAVGSAIGVLFAANTVTGVWNLWDGRHDPNGRTLRFIHGLLMMAADVGFLATANAVPNRRSLNGLLNYETDKATHRNIAYASMGVATIGYTIMLFGGK